MSCRCRLRASVAKQVSRSKCRAVAKQVSRSKCREATVAKQLWRSKCPKQVLRNKCREANLSRSEAPLVAHTKKDETTQAQKQLLSTEKQTDMCGYRSQKQPCARCERLVSCFWWLCFAGIPYTASTRCNTVLMFPYAPASRGITTVSVQLMVTWATSKSKTRVAERSRDGESKPRKLHENLVLRSFAEEPA